MTESASLKLFCPHCGHNCIEAPTEAEPKAVRCGRCGVETRFADLKTAGGDTLEQHLAKMLKQSFGDLLK